MQVTKIEDDLGGDAVVGLWQVGIPFENGVLYGLMLGTFVAVHNFIKPA